MIAIIKREITNYLKKPLFWIGVIIVIVGVFLHLEPYLTIHYVTLEKEQVQGSPEVYYDGDISEGYIPTNEEQRREMWEEMICESLISVFKMNKEEAESVIDVMEKMDIEKACEYLENEYQLKGAIYTYWDTKYHQGTKEEINTYIESKLKNKSFSYYFSRKFADFAGLYMGFFASLMLTVLFLQDTRKNVYELLHTKSVRAGSYVLGKIIGGFSVCLIVLLILNLVFWMSCCIFTSGSGFEVRFTDFVAVTCLYILPNMLMIVCVHGLVSLLFMNPLPAVPFLILYMVYSNMGSRNAEGMYGYYGRPLAIMVRFPGQFFETTPPPMLLLNQSFLILASIGIIFICVQLWKRRRI